MEKRVLVITRNSETVTRIGETLNPMGYEVLGKNGLASGLRAMKGGELVVIDIAKGTEAVREIRAYYPDALVLVIDGEGCFQKAVEDGAYDCLSAPPDTERLKVLARNAFNQIEMKRELDRRIKCNVPGLVLGKSVKMLKVMEQVEKLSAKDCCILVTGEAGTGKEVLARAIHEGSYRRSRPFLKVEASNGDLAGRLFGRAGAPALVLGADGGTVYIDDVSNLPSGDAPGFADFLNEGKFVPGNAADRGDGPIRADIRVICSANGRGVEPTVSKCFKSVVKLPPLRERPEDIPILASEFLSEAEGFLKTESKTLSKEALKTLTRHNWPGNVSELKAALRRACLLAPGNTIEVRHLAIEDGGAVQLTVKEFLEQKLRRYLKDMNALANAGLHSTVMSEVEKALIQIIMEGTQGNQLKAASALGINRTTLRTRLKRYKVRSPGDTKHRET